MSLSRVRGWVLAAWLMSAGAWAQPFNYPGGVVDLSVNKQHSDLPEVKYGINEPAIIDAGTHWRILIGLSLTTLPGDYLLYLKSAAQDSSAEHHKFTVAQRSYPLHDGGHITLERVDRDLQNLSALSFRNTQQPQLPLRFPSDGQWAEQFGHAMQDPNSGELLVQNLVSLTTTELLNVVAPQNAFVSKIETNENQLNTVYLDHGRGLYSIIDGLSDLSVSMGEGVVAGAVLGKLPAQTADNGPKRLSWQCVLNGVYVDPVVLTKL